MVGDRCPKSVPAGLEEVFPNLLVPVVPIIQGDEPEYSLFHSLDSRNSAGYGGPLMPILEYDSVPTLLRNLTSQIIEPVLELSTRRNECNDSKPERRQRW